MTRSGARAGAAILLTTLAVSLSSLEAAAQAPTSRLDRVFHGLGYRFVSASGIPPLARLEVDELGPYWLTETEWRDAAARLAALPEGGTGGIIVPSPHASGALYHAGAGLHRTEDEGRTWRSIGPEPAPAVSVLAESALEPGLLWAGTEEGAVLLSRDGGATWVETGPEPAGRVSALEPSPHDGAKAYAGLVTNDSSDGPEAAAIYRTDDHGATWRSLLPPPADGGAAIQGRVTSIREDPELAGLLLVGTSEGMFISFDDGGSWDGFQLDLPPGPVSELRVLGRDLLVAVDGRGVWVMRDITPLRQVLEGLSRGEPHLFEPAPAYRLDALPGEELVAPPDNPMADAAIDYLLPSFVRDVRIEILDDSGALVRAFGSDGRPTDAPSEPEEPSGQGRAGRPSGTRAGVHRVVWDLRTVDDAGVPGEPVAPGVYRVRMTVDGIVREQPLEILPDPRAP